MELTKWTERKFDFTFPAGVFPAILERLRGTPLRLEYMLDGLGKDILTKRTGTGWSIQEHAGHLLDLDGLHEKRLNQYIANTGILFPADMTNKKTFLADHNSKNIETILTEFKAGREKFVNAAEKLDELVITRTAIHPRLNKDMRLVDMLYFTAEHDDHHLAVIRNLIKRYSI